MKYAAGYVVVKAISYSMYVEMFQNTQCTNKT